MYYFWLALCGVLSGILGGLGMGGGTLLIPLLTIFLNVNQIQSQGINLIAFIPMSIVALIIHAKNKLINYKVCLPIVLSGVLFSVLGAFLANSVNTITMRKLFGIFLVALGLFQGGSFFILPNNDKKKRNNTKPVKS